jgi:hypothetical protein
VRVSSRLAEASQQMPSNAILQNVICDAHPHTGGGYSDVRKAFYDGKAVAVKSFRVHMDKSSMWSALDGVSISLHPNIPSKLAVPIVWYHASVLGHPPLGRH